MSPSCVTPSVREQNIVSLFGATYLMYWMLYWHFLSCSFLSFYPMALVSLRNAVAALARSPQFLNCRSASCSFSSWLLERPNPLSPWQPLPPTKPHSMDLKPFLMRWMLFNLQPVAGFKGKLIPRKRCKDCFIVRRRGTLYVYCKTHPRHKQRQL